MKTIKIARISGEFLNEQGEVCSYLQPYTGYDFNQWFPIRKAKKIFDSLNFDSITKEEDDVLEKRTKEDMELEILMNAEDGFKPRLYLFTVEIPKYVWENKKKLAEKSGYEDDFLTYITDYTDYNWKLEQDVEVKIPKHLTEMFDNFVWIQDNKEKLQMKYMQFLIETGNPDDLELSDFEMFMANGKRDIVEL